MSGLDSDNALVFTIERPGNRDRTDEEQGAGGGNSRPDNPWEPFDTEMDWRFASWAIQEGIKLSSIDRALSIPGVSGIFSLPLEPKLTERSVQGETRTLLPQYSGSPPTRRLTSREGGVARTMDILQRQTGREAPASIPRHHSSDTHTPREPGTCAQDCVSPTTLVPRRVAPAEDIQ